MEAKAKTDLIITIFTTGETSVMIVNVSLRLKPFGYKFSLRSLNALMNLFDFVDSLHPMGRFSGVNALLPRFH